MVAQPALLAAALRERHPTTAKFLGHRHGQVPGALQVLEILVEETVLAVVARAASGEAAQHIAGQDLFIGLH